MTPQVWFITGTSTGFGRVMTEHVLQNGGFVVATLRKPVALADFAARYPKDRLLILKLDVAVASQIPPAFQQAIDAFGRVDVVFNNAGMCVVGEAEISPEEEARRLFDTNYWGAVNVSREAIRVFREVNPAGVGGRLLQNSSMAGLGPLALFGHYVASKHALEGFTKTLATELDPSWNIKVTLIEPGFFQTEIVRQAKVVPIHPTYDDERASEVRDLMAAGDLPGDIEKGVSVIYNVARLSDPPLHFPLGGDGVVAMKTAGELLVTTVKQYGSWSQNLLKAEMGKAAITIKNAYQ
ncbi:NAD(P)-binding protein [Calocera cornea HHB12733]|uniref:NAD(P)-binding protein n=1 Tax=Calocera cornea HHB12733 TaxID=1353952 RepID=A0A165FXJ0_9BASI|nr:NAD(P)-binding protein [Calocera cornea HHB12733]